MTRREGLLVGSAAGGGVLLLLGLALAIRLAGGRPAPTADPEPSRRLPSGAPLKVWASKVWNDYRDNAIAADEKYKGRELEIAGPVSEIGPDRVGFAVVSPVLVEMPVYNRMTPREKKWYNFGYPPNVVCHVPVAYRSDFADAKKDKQLSLIGRCTGCRKDPDVWMGLVVEFENCRRAPTP